MKRVARKGPSFSWFLSAQKHQQHPKQEHQPWLLEASLDKNRICLTGFYLELYLPFVFHLKVTHLFLQSLSSELERKSLEMKNSLINTTKTLNDRHKSSGWCCSHPLMNDSHPEATQAFQDHWSTLSGRSLKPEEHVSAEQSPVQMEPLLLCQTVSFQLQSQNCSIYWNNH